MLTQCSQFFSLHPDKARLVSSVSRLYAKLNTVCVLYIYFLDSCNSNSWHESDGAQRQDGGSIQSSMWPRILNR